MKGANSRLAAAMMAAAMLAAAAAGQQTAKLAVASEAVQKGQKPEREIVVSLEDRRLAFIENGEVRKIYAVAVGKPSTPSPQGTFTIQRRVVNPTYHHDGKTVLPGPNNPVGTRWMGLNKAGYGIHGTNEPKSIGKAASHGCIRMAKVDLEEIFRMVAVGDTVRLIGHSDEETARLFGSAPAPVIALEPLLTAHVDDVPLGPAADTAFASNNAPAAMVASMGTR